MLLRRIARPLLAAPFLVDGADALIRPGHRVEATAALLENRQQSPGGIAEKISAHPATFVRINAGAQIVGGALLSLGRAPRIAASLLAITVVPAAITQQDFWAEQDPERKAAKRAAFLKDMSLLGGLLIASADTQGKPSLGWRGKRAARNAVATVSAALPLGSAADASTGGVLREHLHDTAVRAQALAATAAEKGAELASVAQARGSKLADAVKEHGPEWAEGAQERGAELAELAKDRGTELAEIAKERGPELASATRKRAAQVAERVRDRIETRMSHA